MTPRPLIDALGHCLFNSFKVKYVFFFLSNLMPLYCLGQETGVVVDIGNHQATILPVVKSRICNEGL